MEMQREHTCGRPQQNIHQNSSSWVQSHTVEERYFWDSELLPTVGTSLQAFSLSHCSEWSSTLLWNPAPTRQPLQHGQSWLVTHSHWFKPMSETFVSSYQALVC